MTNENEIDSVPVTLKLASGMAGKLTTGLTGLAVNTHAKLTLTILYDKLLRTLDKMPKEAAYRKYTEDIVKTRLQIVEKETDVAKMETRINCGQIEEVILQAERELSLARNMVVWKPWEPLMGEAPKNQWKWPIA